MTALDASPIQQADDLRDSACLAKPRENPSKAIDVSVGVHVGHGIDGQCDIETELES